MEMPVDNKLPSEEVVMNLLDLLWAVAMLAGVSAITPTVAQGGDEDLAKKCEAMSLKAHPATLPQTQSTSNLRRSYYDLCVSRHGIMDPTDPNR
jgi:hypothetical protein